MTKKSKIILFISAGLAVLGVGAYVMYAPSRKLAAQRVQARRLLAHADASSPCCSSKSFCISEMIASTRRNASGPCRLVRTFS